MRHQQNRFLLRTIKEAPLRSTSRTGKVEYRICERQLRDSLGHIGVSRELQILWLSNAVIHTQKRTIQIQASSPKVHRLLGHVDAINTFLGWIPIEISPVFRLIKSLYLLVKRSLVSCLRVALRVLKGDALR